MAKIEKIESADHKCLVYLHKKGVCSIPVRREGKNVVYTNLLPGYNSVNFSEVSFIAEQCKSHIDKGLISFWKIDISYDENGKAKVKENAQLSGISATELRTILKETLNKATLEDLGNPDIVGTKNQDFAATRIEEIAKATGMEPESIDIKEEEKK